MKVGQWVRLWRKNSQLSQEELATSLGWSRDKLHRIEVSDRKNIDFTEILKLCRILNRPVDEVVNIALPDSGKDQIQWHPLSVESQSWIRLVDDLFKTDIASLLTTLGNEFDTKWGFAYELGGATKQYYSNVHSTVMLFMFLSGLLEGRYLTILQDVLFFLRESGLRGSRSKSPSDKYAWDDVEGPSCFSTSLACYALLMTGFNKNEDLAESIKWLIEQRNDKAIWPVFKKGGSNNFVTTLYSLLALKLWQKKTSPAFSDQKVSIAFSEIKQFIEGSFQIMASECAIAEYGSKEPSLSNTIACLYILKLVESERFSEFLRLSKKTIDQMVANGPNWWISILSEDQELPKIKRMYTYNPAYIPLLIRMGWRVDDSTISKMLSWLVKDLQTHWVRPNVTYPWRSSDSVIQSFIFMLSVYSIHSWVEESLRIGWHNNQYE